MPPDLNRYGPSACAGPEPERPSSGRSGPLWPGLRLLAAGLLCLLIFSASCAPEPGVRPEGKTDLIRQQYDRSRQAGPDDFLPPLADRGLFPVDAATRLTLARELSPAAQGLERWQDFAPALQRSLDYVRRRPPEGQTRRRTASTVFLQEDLAAALETMIDLLPRLDQADAAGRQGAAELLAESFDWYRVGPDFGFTGYYEPELPASPVRTERFRYPLYKRPPELNAKKGRRARYTRRHPYHSRHAIDRQHVLAGRDLEIAWLDDPVEAFILHIQGSGSLIFPDGRRVRALYNGQNLHPYTSLGAEMRDRGLLDPENINMSSIRAWLALHPDQRDELLDANASYIFFRLSDDPPVGSMGAKLTPWVSVATDTGVLPHGSLTIMRVSPPAAPTSNSGSGETPEKNPDRFLRKWAGVPRAERPLAALTLPQDRGGAIRRNRVDLFCGPGEKARHISAHLDSEGAVFMLLPKKVEARQSEGPAAGTTTPS